MRLGALPVALNRKRRCIEVAVINLFIALFWLVLGLGLIFIPGFEVWRIRGTELSIGWLAIGLAGYNFLRWWLTVRQPRPRREPQDDQPSVPEYNPEFDFTKDEPEKK